MAILATMSGYSLEKESDSGVGAGIDFADPDGPLAPLYLRNGHVVTAILLAAIFVLLNFARLNHTDIWGHLRFGEAMLDSRTFPAGEQFCPYAEPSVSTVKYAWLSQVLFAIVFRAGEFLGGSDPLARIARGADALRFLLAVLVLARFWQLFFAFRRVSGSNLLAACGVLFVASLSLSLAVIRPQVVAEVLFAGLLVLLTAPQYGWKTVVGIVAVLVVWANAHGSYPIGLATVGITLAARLATHLFGPPPRLFLASIDTDLRNLALALLLAVLGVAFLNPEGPRIFLGTAEMARQPNVRAMDEWQPLWSPVATGGRVVYSIAVSVLAAAFLVARARPAPLFLLGVAMFAIPPLLSQRTLLWLLTAIPWLTLPEFAKGIRRWQPTWWNSVPSFRKTLLVGMFVGLALMWSIPVQHAIGRKPARVELSLSDGTPWREALAVESPKLVPETPLARELVTTYPGGKFVGTIFASDTLGDFFLWKLQAPVPVFMYSHVHLFSAEQWSRFTQIRDARPGWQTALDAAGINLVVFYAEQNFAI
ncbi:MAG: hypothetical protein K1X57_15505, partial [Gemmataceae bacterium]|nr:hypothetical protein [Gemmataceae bacterium]